MFQNLNYWAILVAAASYFLLGAVWYGMLFGKVWIANLGKSMDELKKNASAMPYVIAGITSLAAVSMMAVVLRAAGWDASIGQAVIVAIMMWVGFALSPAASHYAFSQVSPKLLAIDYGYDLTAFIIMSIILASWK